MQVSLRGPIRHGRKESSKDAVHDKEFYLSQISNLYKQVRMEAKMYALYR